ncbi:hypothetical protein KBTX_02382 [wastewater metagenome]|uniref:Tripartite ATP-independent periplasmic transporters DctQ component domain-containing protein n=2 Tax=unclassified sequences TaxID=12908 RepID=A0A5B8RD65_9ZZZZ|nr:MULTISPECIES: TRAP transporter small permease subunit [Arhodomonas]MCS4503064.1 TRAP transporter small permease [Arhodomonas aquaeolei]QEA06053.1 hypothetical protein KBTEX_02382 [uncultured organism]
MIETLDRITARIDRVLLVIGCLFLAVMMIQITVDVLLRAIFNASVPVTLETVSYYYMIFAVFLPLSYVERRNAHIKVDLFTQLMPERVQFALHVLACLIGVGFFGALAYQSFLDAVDATIKQQTVMSNFIFYIWPSRWALPIGFAATCLAIINNMAAAVIQRRAL